MDRDRKTVRSGSGGGSSGLQEEKVDMRGGDSSAFQVEHGSVVELPIELIEPNPWNP